MQGRLAEPPVLQVHAPQTAGQADHTVLPPQEEQAERERVEMVVSVPVAAVEEAVLAVIAERVVQVAHCTEMVVPVQAVVVAADRGGLAVAVPQNILAQAVAVSVL